MKSRDLPRQLRCFANSEAAEAPVVVEQDALVSKLLSENSILRKEAFDGVLLSAVDPAGKDR